MKRDFSAPLRNLDGSVICEEEKNLSAGQVACNALLLPRMEDTQLSGEDKVLRYKLAIRIHGAEGPVDLAAEDVALLKKVVAQTYAPLIVGQFYELMEADHEPLA